MNDDIDMAEHAIGNTENNFELSVESETEYDAHQPSESETSMSQKS